MQTDRSPDMTIVRDYDAPRELLFEVWTQAEHMTHWWGPSGFTAPEVRSDPRPGGELYLVMQGPDGTRYPLRGTYEAVDPPARLVLVAGPVDDSFTVRHLVNFDTRGGKTRVTVHAWILRRTPAADAALMGMHEGWSQQLDRLVGYLAEVAR